MHYAIMGAGSVGAYIGARMARAGMKVTFIDQWPEHVNAMRGKGLRVECTDETFQLRVNALHLHEVQRLITDPIDVALLCVKSYDTGWSAALLKDYLAPKGFVASAQNSCNEEAIAKVLGWDAVLGCIVNTIGVELHGPGHVVRWAPPAPPGFPVFRIGEVHSRITARAKALAEAMQCADNTTVTSNLWGERWSKVTHNAMGSGLCAIFGIGLLAMYRDPVTCAISIRLVQEAIDVGQRLGFELEDICGVAPQVWLDGRSDAQARQHIEQSLEKWTLRIREDGQTSSLHDLRRGRRMETDHINGLVVQRAAEVGAAVPTHAKIVALTHRIERGERLDQAAALEYLKE